MSSKILWSIIIPSHNSSPRLKEIIKKLIECSKNVDSAGEVLVIDDKSTNTFDYSGLMNEHLNVMVIHNKFNLGQCKSENLGASKARGKILIFLDDDCIPSSKEFIVKVIENYLNNKLVIAGNIITSASHNSIENVRFPLADIGNNTIVGPEGLQGGCFVIDKNLFIKIGGFRENLAYFYDIDLGYKINEAGYEINKTRDLLVTHLDKEISLNKELKKTYDAYVSSYRSIVDRYPKSKKSFYWGTTLSERELLIDKISFHKSIFKLILAIYSKIFMYIPRFIRIEIYNYLHRCAIYYAVKGMSYL